jgi:CBS-domain-containing membrane protein
MSPSIYVRASTQFQSLVLTLAATRIHQLYFVDDLLHPVGSVKIGDVLKLLIADDGDR